MPDNMQDFYQAITNDKDALRMRTYTISPVNDRWVIIYEVAPSRELRYLDTCDVKQDCINRVLTELGC